MLRGVGDLEDKGGVCTRFERLPSQLEDDHFGDVVKGSKLDLEFNRGRVVFRLAQIMLALPAPLGSVKKSKLRAHLQRGMERASFFYFIVFLSSIVALDLLTTKCL